MGAGIRRVGHKSASRSCGLLLAVCAACAGAQEPAVQSPPAAVASPAPAATAVPAVPDSASVAAPGPIAIVQVDAAASVTGALQVTQGKAIIAANGTVSSGANTTEVILPHRGVLRICASTTVKLAVDASVPAGEAPGLMMAIDHGAIEASFATGRNSDVLLTPDFRILIGAPGSADVKVRLGAHGDTCEDNGGDHAPYVLVTSVFDGGAYRVQPGQRVMFQHGSLQEVVDQEKEPCGCPPAPRPGSNDFPLAQSAGLSPVSPPVAAPAMSKPAPTGSKSDSALNEPLVYQATAVPEPAASTPAPSPSESTAAAAPTAPPKQAEKKPGFFHRLGSFFRRVFGAE